MFGKRKSKNPYPASKGWKVDGIYATKLLAQKANKKLVKEGYSTAGYQRADGKWMVKYKQ